jgi:hypothetical protein
MKVKVELMFVLFVLLIVSLCALPANAQSKTDIRGMIEESAMRNGVDPDLAVAIATVESSLNPEAIGSKGEIGVFQLRPEFHPVKPGSVEHNIEVAVIYLSTIRQKWQGVYGDAWFIKFNLGPNYRQINHPKLFAYYIKVKQVMSQKTVAKN